MDKTATVSLTFNSCVNPVLYSMRMKSFRKHLRDMLCCKKRGQARVQTAEMRTLHTTGQPDELTRNTKVQRPFPYSSKSKKELVTSNRGSVDLKTSAKIRKGGEVHVTGDVSTDISNVLQPSITNSKKSKNSEHFTP